MSENPRLHKRRVPPIGLLAIAITACAVLGVALAAEIAQFGILVNPQGNVSPEKLMLLNYTINNDQNEQNPTRLSLWLENDGVAYSELSTLTLLDLSSTNVPSTTLKLNQTIGPGGSKANITVDTIASGFYFIHGHSYRFTVDTSRGIEFLFPASYP